MDDASIIQSAWEDKVGLPAAQLPLREAVRRFHRNFIVCRQSLLTSVNITRDKLGTTQKSLGRLGKRNSCPGRIPGPWNGSWFPRDRNSITPITIHDDRRQGMSSSQNRATTRFDAHASSHILLVSVAKTLLDYFPRLGLTSSWQEKQ